MTVDQVSRDEAGAGDSLRRNNVIVRPAGESGVLFELPPEDVTGLAAWLAGPQWADVVEDVVPSRCTVLVRARSSLDEIVASVRSGSWATASRTERGAVFRFAVRYNGPDLEAVSEATGLSSEQIVELHTGVDHVVQHFGFSPGFPYLSGSPTALDVPRRSSPRQLVPGGSVAIAGCVTVIYPGGTPGGWNIIGQTEAPVFWDLDRDRPNLLSLGDRIIFERA